MIEIVSALPADLPEILKLQKSCYRQEAAIYGDYAIQPLTQTEAEMIEECRTETVLKAVESGGIVGSVRARETDGTCRICKLIVHPDFQNRGLGAALMQAIEARFPDAARFELYTGFKSEKNLHLYQKLGYKKFKEEKVSDSFTMVYLEKKRTTDDTDEDG